MLFLCYIEELKRSLVTLNLARQWSLIIGSIHGDRVGDDDLARLHEQLPFSSL